MAQQAALAAARFGRNSAANSGHMLQHDPASPPARGLARGLAFAKGHGKPGGQLFGLCKIGLGAVRQRIARDGGKPLIRNHVVTLINHDGQIPLTDLAERFGVGVQSVGVIAGIGANARGQAIVGRAVIVRRDQSRRPPAAHLQRQLPAQLDGLTDQRGQQGCLCHQRFDLRGIVMLAQHLTQNTVQTGHTATNVGPVKLKGQDGVVPGDLSAGRHGVS